ncbi:MAG: DUF4224 domain-containing protein [Rubrivivax sp.]
MAGALLDDEDLQRLTGTKQPKRQCAWLDKHSWVYLPPERRGDRPKVARAYHDARLSGQTPSQPAGERRRVGPRVNWMLNAASYPPPQPT